MHNKVSLPLCDRDKFADKSASSMKTKVDHVNLLASKEITRFLVQHPLCNQFHLWGTRNLQQSLTNQPWSMPGGHRSVGLCDWGLAEGAYLIYGTMWLQRTLPSLGYKSFSFLSVFSFFSHCRRSSLVRRSWRREPDSSWSRPAEMLQWKPATNTSPTQLQLHQTELQVSVM